MYKECKQLRNKNVNADKENGSDSKNTNSYYYYKQLNEAYTMKQT